LLSFIAPGIPIILLYVFGSWVSTIVVIAVLGVTRDGATHLSCTYERNTVQ
jgi:hypothetical protein